MVTVKFFASLRERMGASQVRIPCPEPATVAAVWAAVNDGGTLEEGILAALNHDYVDTTHAVRDGDEVAFFPPVTGG